MFRIILLSFLGLVFLFPNKVWAQEEIRDSTVEEKEDFLAFYPLLFYFPETRLGFGAASVYNFYPGEIKSARPSQWQLGAAYTLNKQILLYASYQYFLKDNTYELFGELGYYDYFYFYYGIGNDTQVAKEETYFVRFPRFRINALKQIYPNFRVGLSYKFDDYNIYQTASGGLLESLTPSGYQGSLISTIGLLARYDTRDNINLPRKGSFYTFSMEHNAEFLGSDFAFSRFLFDLSHYIPIRKKSLIALNLYTGWLNGDPTFQELLFMGGPRRARGIVEGQYRDHSILLYQAAYRFPLFWRFRGTLFASTGRVAPKFRQLWEASYHFNYGVGLRFLLDPEEGIQIRFDIGFGDSEARYYLTIGEAF